MLEILTIFHMISIQIDVNHMLRIPALNITNSSEKHKKINSSNSQNENALLCKFFILFLVYFFRFYFNEFVSINYTFNLFRVLSTL